MLNLDTHILLHALRGDLSKRERGALAKEAWSVSAIVHWELCKLVQLGRVELDLDDVEVIQILSAIHVWPITITISRQSCALDFRSDPADEIIAATSLVHRVPLVTRDKKILTSKMVPFCSVVSRRSAS